MAGTVLERELTDTCENGPRFAVAKPTDDAEIRRLLRENPMSGRISLSFEREPDYFADARLPGETKQTIIARENGRVVCCGTCAIRDRFVNGEARRVGYLGALRLDARCAGRFDILRRGYEFFKELQNDAPAEFYFTSIAADNERARRILERGLRGMPRYEFLGEFVSVLVPTTGRIPSQRLNSASAATCGDEVLDFLEKRSRRHQFAPRWSAEALSALEQLGLQTSNFHTVRGQGRIVAAAALWDQRPFRQTVIRGYAPSVKLLRPVHNLVARSLGRPRLPAIGATLANAYVSHLAADGEKELTGLVSHLRGVAGERGIELLTLGFAANDPRLGAVTARFPHREYRSRLHVVRWPDLGGWASELDNRILAPEAALL